MTDTTRDRNRHLPRLRATFRNLKVHVLRKLEILPCDLEMELRPVTHTAGLYQIYYVSTNRPLSVRNYTRLGAQERIRKLFQQQLTEWREVETEESNV